MTIFIGFIIFFTTTTIIGFQFISYFQSPLKTVRDRTIIQPISPSSSPTTFQGKQIVINESMPVNEEFQTIWQNLQSFKNRQIDGVKIIKDENPLYSIAANGNGISLSDVKWKIQAKRDSLTKIAIKLIHLCSSEQKAEEAFLNGHIETLIFEDTKKSVTITFVANCLHNE